MENKTETKKEEKSKGYEIEVNDGKRKYKCLLREPGFAEYSGALLAMSLPSGRSDRIAGGLFIINACWISGDLEIKDSENHVKICVSACFDAVKLTDVFSSKIKKK